MLHHEQQFREENGGGWIHESPALAGGWSCDRVALVNGCEL